MAKKRTTHQIDAFSELENICWNNEITEQYDYEELGKLISHFLRQEKPYIRYIFIRRYFFMDSIQDIASKYSYTESKVKNILYHARKKLKIFLEKEGILI